MKVLLVNKYFYLKGGSERVFFNEARLLENQGHRVIYFSMSDERNLSCPQGEYFVDNIDYANPGGFKERLSNSFKILYSFEAEEKIRRLLRREKPDIAHLHNIHHQLSPSIIPVLKKNRIPIVMTLHDYKMVCPSYSMVARGRPCERCRGGRYYWCLLRGCTKGSYAKSLVNVAEMYLHHSFLRIYDQVDVFLSPSLFLLEKLKEMGFRKKIFHLPYSFDAEHFEPRFGSASNTICYFGRLSAEKGLFTLLEAMKGVDAPLKIIGSGPIREALLARVKSERLPGIQFLNHLTGDALISEIRNSQFVVVPSEWYENYPNVILESFALGKPVVGARIGGIPELVKDDETGLTFEPGNAADLRAGLKTLSENPARCVRMGRAARNFVKSNLNPDRHYHSLVGFYRLAGAR